MHRRERWCGDITSPLRASEPELSLADCAGATRPGGPLTGGSRATMRSLRSPAWPPQWLARDLLPLGFAHSSRNNKIARPAVLRCAAGLKAAGRPSRR